MLLRLAAALLLVVAGCASRPSGSAPAVTPAAAEGRAPVPSAADGPFDASTPDALTASVARLLRAASPSFTVDVLSPLTLHLDARASDKHDLRISLDRIWAACSAEPRSCEVEARTFVQKVTTTVQAPTAKATRDQVVALLRPRRYFEAMGGGSAAGVTTDPFVGDVLVVYVVDLPEAVRSLGQSDLDALRLARGDLRALAEANLATRLGSVVATLVHAKAGDVAVLQTGNHFETSRLLLSDEWAALSAKVGAPIYAAAPDNGALVVAFGPSAEQIVALRGVIGKIYAKGERPISPELLRWGPQGWAIVP